MHSGWILPFRSLTLQSFSDGAGRGECWHLPNFLRTVPKEIYRRIAKGGLVDWGRSPTVMVAITVLVAVLITLTLSFPKLGTYTKSPLGRTLISKGPSPTVIVATTVLVHQALNPNAHTLVLFLLLGVEKILPDDECRDINALCCGITPVFPP